MNLGDGGKASNRRKSMGIAAKSHLVASRIRALAVRRGWRCNIRFQEPPEDEPNHKGVWILNLFPSSLLTVASGSFSDSTIKIGERVWCVQTRTGTIITRRNGKVVIVGNSWHRHGSLAADRHWQLGMTNRIVASERQERLREKKEPEPITCPACGKVRASGAKCPVCGFEAHRKARLVVQVNGTLREVKGRHLPSSSSRSCCPTPCNSGNEPIGGRKARNGMQPLRRRKPCSFTRTTTGHRITFH